MPDTGCLRDDIQALLDNLADQLQTANWSAVYPSIIDAAERDPEINTMQAALHHAFMAPFAAVIERAKARGEISLDRVTIDLIAALTGPLLYRRWFSREPIDARFVSAIIGAVIR